MKRKSLKSPNKQKDDQDDVVFNTVECVQQQQFLKANVLIFFLQKNGLKNLEIFADQKFFFSFGDFLFRIFIFKFKMANGKRL